MGCERRAVIEPVKRNQEAADPFERRDPPCYAIEIVDEPIERALNQRKGRGRLRQLAERHAAREEFRGAKHKPDYRRQQRVRMRYQSRAHQSLAQLPPLLEHVA